MYININTYIYIYIYIYIYMYSDIPIYMFTNIPSLIVRMPPMPLLLSFAPGFLALDIFVILAKPWLMKTKWYQWIFQ